MLRLAVELSDDIDVTGLATLALAVVTVVLAVVGGVALRQTKEGLDLTRREVESAQRPVLIPVTDETKQIQAAGSSPIRLAKPYFVESHRLVVPVKNIGVGAALKIQVEVTPRNDAGDRSDAWGSDRHVGTLVGLGVSEIAAAMIEIPRLADLPNFDVWLTYEDVAGKAWVSSAKYLKSDGYTLLGVATG